MTEKQLQLRRFLQATRTPGLLIYFGGYAALLAWFKLADVYHTQFATRGVTVVVYNAFRVLFIFYLFWIVYAVGALALRWVGGRPTGLPTIERLVLGFFTGAGLWHIGLLALGYLNLSTVPIAIAVTVPAVAISYPDVRAAIVACWRSISSSWRTALAEAGRSEYEIIVIDDCSADRSADLVEDYIRTHPDDRILLARNKRNRGLAQNYFDAAFIGKGKYYRLICGDDAEPVDTMVTVFREIGQADMLIPYYVSSEGKSLSRRIISNSYSSLVNFISGSRLHYYNGLAVHLRYNVMRWHPNTRGFGFQADIICMLLDQGFTFKEIPVRTIERKKGDSRALTSKNMLSVFHTLVDIIVRRISNRVYQHH